jgi:hypothetical protein
MFPNFNHQPAGKISLDKILFSLASVYLVAVVFWLAGQGKLKLPWITNNSKVITSQKQPLSPADAEFIVYLQQSLDQLEKQSSQPQPANISVPSPPVPSNSAAETKIVEKIYIPVYPQNNNPSLTVPPNSVAVNPRITNNTVPPPPPVSSVPSSTQAIAPPTTVPVLTPAGNLLPTTPPPSVANPDNLLVGLLEAGEQSSALFNFNGSTRRVQIGEAIGTTGWTLKGVQNQQAVISHQGNVRYIEVGKGF